jgi:U4/U6.U5 tri-snRNP-associated protein 2
MENDEMINKKRHRDSENINNFQEPEEKSTKLKSNSEIISKSHSEVLSQFQNLKKTTIDCPYLGTIKRHLLDFDFEKVCSISLSNLNIYTCLICGKYYQGRGINTHAYIHSLEQDHHLFINLQDQRIFCLPDGYEVTESSLNDIKFNSRPYFTGEDIKKLDTSEKISRALDGTEYIPGCIGLNNIKRTDYANVIIQALTRVENLRNFFLQYDDTTTDLKFDPQALFMQRMAELFRKIWNPKNFKGHVSPHEVMQSITLASNNKFKIVEQSDAINFLSWFLNTAHEYLLKKNKKNNSGKSVNSTIISDCFQGRLLIETFTILKESDLEKITYLDKIIEEDGVKYKYESKEQNFYYLTLDLPKAPLFKDSTEKINIPQISIFELLSKYDGTTFTDDPIKSQKRRHKILRLPKNLLLFFKRFDKNLFFVEKNNTIVTFPIKNLSLEKYVEEKIMNRNLKYDLTANIIHDGKPQSGSFRVQVKNKPNDKWYDIQDLNINQIMAQSVVVSESYIHIYEGHKSE